MKTGPSGSVTYFLGNLAKDRFIGESSTRPVRRSLARVGSECKDASNTDRRRGVQDVVVSIAVPGSMRVGKYQLRNIIADKRLRNGRRTALLWYGSCSGAAVTGAVGRSRLQPRRFPPWVTTMSSSGA